jgi:3-hydroxyisobutyrate dehydrogenase-like beta-hydroxyacid dehydrogenase
MTNVSVIGLGMMGSALAETLLAQKMDVTVWNRSSQVSFALGAKGARVADTVKAAIGASKTIFICVRDYDASHAVLNTPVVKAALAGRTIIQLTSGTASQARISESWANDIGAQYLDGAILGFPADIGTASISVIYSGNFDIYERCQSLFAALGGSYDHVGSDVGAAAVLDNSILLIYFSAHFGMMQGAALCSSAGISLEKYHKASAPFLAGMGGVFKRSLEMIDCSCYETDQSTIETRSAVLHHIAALSDENGVDNAFVHCMQNLADTAIAQGHGSQNPAALFELFKSKNVL